MVLTVPAYMPTSSLSTKQLIRAVCPSSATYTASAEHRGGVGGGFRCWTAKERPGRGRVFCNDNFIMASCIGSLFPPTPYRSTLTE